MRVDQTSTDISTKQESQESFSARCAASSILSLGSAVAVLLSLSGCVSVIGSERLRAEAALALHVPEESVSVDDIRFSGLNHYYTARVHGRGSFECLMNGGTILSYGLTNPAVCRRQET